jgi:hypothetical protein
MLLHLLVHHNNQSKTTKILTLSFSKIYREDPDPIYYCQVLDICPVVPGGKVVITAAVVSPKSGPLGTTFNLAFSYKVVNTTSPGLIVVDITDPQGNPMGAEDFVDTQPVGTYNASWQLQAQPSEQEPFPNGVYQVEYGVCAGDCTNAHPYGGVYAAAQTTFTITGQQ